MFDHDSEVGLLPWEGDDELAEAKEKALQAQQEEVARAARVPRGITRAADRLPLKAPEVKPGDAPSVSSSDLPELAEFVRTLGRVNRIYIHKDLHKAGYLVRIGGRYVEAGRRGKRQSYFANATINGRHTLLVTKAGQGLLGELLVGGKLTLLTKGHLTEQEREQRSAQVRKLRAARAETKFRKKLALEAKQPQVLAELDAKIEDSIARRASARARMSAASKAQMNQYLESKE
ncbi:hypothetical protein [Caballeronia sp. AZ10_KS36]|uniref:hypothetical protein n=1 Tax=Caballeronia sp. AZ10_KS36 TaxID=2921757 RepID=UPI002028C280|nr:hypothetical protein [Caballeronia sp. AZ10_KS36]